jgi:hypothetical protein
MGGEIIKGPWSGSGEQEPTTNREGDRFRLLDDEPKLDYALPSAHEAQ